jgi:hypothetical protein
MYLTGRARRAQTTQADVMREIKAVPEVESLRFVFDVPGAAGTGQPTTEAEVCTRPSR